MNFKDYNGVSRQMLRDQIKQNQKMPFFGNLVYQERVQNMKDFDKLGQQQRFPDEHNYQLAIRESMQNLRDL